MKRTAFEQSVLDETAARNEMHRRRFSRIGRKIHYVRRTRSTMDLAADVARKGEPEGLVVVADEQTAGRGRHGRSWVSAPGRDLLLSIVFRPRPAILPQIQFVMAIAAANTIWMTVSRPATVKWPNDILVNGSKVCGLLVESHDGPDGLFAIAGVGLNLYTSSHTSPGLPPATSLSELTPDDVTRNSVLEELINQADNLYENVLDGQSLLQGWSDMLETTGQYVSVQSGGAGGPEEPVCGLAEGVDEHGRLLVRDSDGRLWPFSAGDVTLSGQAAG